MRTKKRYGIGILCLMLMLAVGFFPARAAAKTVNLEVQHGTDITKDLQKALDEHRYTSLESLEVVIPAGTYTISSTLNIYSNTVLSMQDVTLERGSFTASMLRFGRSGECAGMGGYSRYSGFSNITFKGGVWDSKAKDGGIMRFAHANQIRFENVTFTNVKNSHHIEFAGCSDVAFLGCTFSNFSGNTLNATNYEALQLDVMRSEHFGNYGKYDETPCKNITISGCLFENLKRGLGSHSAVAGSYFTNIQVTGNTFKNIIGYAVMGTNYKNSVISDNVMTDCGSGIFLRSMVKGHNNFYTPQDGQVKITRNLATTVARNTIEVKYKGYKNNAFGVSLYGENLEKQDKNVPKGDYTIEGIKILNNKITLGCKGYAVWIQGGDKNRVSKNTITVKVQGGAGGNGDGIRVERGESNTIDSNKITNKLKTGAGAEMCGISIIEGSNKTTLKGNTITGSSKDGISVKSSKNVKLQSNTVSKSGRDGISIKKSKGAVLKKNKSTSNARFGLNVTDSSTAKESASTCKKNKLKDKNCSNGAKVNGKTKF